MVVPASRVIRHPYNDQNNNTTEDSEHRTTGSGDNKDPRPSTKRDSKLFDGARGLKNLLQASYHRSWCLWIYAGGIGENE